jgi:hypothetical protein
MQTLVAEVTMHLTDPDVGASLDPTGGGTKGNTARAHVATCAACARVVRRAQAAEHEVADTLQLLDHSSPALDFAVIRRLAAERDRPLAAAEVSASTDPARRASRRSTRFGAPGSSDLHREGRSRMETVQIVIRRGAIILGISAAAAAAATPRSPVRQFFAQLGAKPRRSVPSSSLAVAPMALRPAGVVAVPQGVAITATGRVELVFRTAPPAGVLRIRPALGTRVAVTANVDGPTYLVGRGTIVIDSQGTPGVNYDIELPAAAQVAEVVIQIGARAVYVRHGATVLTDGHVQTDGSYLIAMAPDDSRAP